LDLEGEADEVVVLETPPWFMAIGHFYVDFSPTSDEEVVALLEQALSQTSPNAGPQGAMLRPGERTGGRG
jgi:putative phosphoribosyl transferase